MTKFIPRNSKKEQNKKKKKKRQQLNHSKEKNRIYITNYFLCKNIQIKHEN